MDRLTSPEMAAELMKLLRGRWMTGYATAQEMGLHWQRCNRWVETLHANGLLINRPAAVRRGGLEVFE